MRQKVFFCHRRCSQSHLESSSFLIAEHPILSHPISLSRHVLVMACDIEKTPFSAQRASVFFMSCDFAVFEGRWQLPFRAASTVSYSAASRGNSCSSASVDLRSSRTLFDRRGAVEHPLL